MCKVFCGLVCVCDFKTYPRDLDSSCLIPPSPFFLSTYKNISSKSLLSTAAFTTKPHMNPFTGTPTDAQIWLFHGASVSARDMSSMIHDSK